MAADGDATRETIEYEAAATDGSLRTDLMPSLATRRQVAIQLQATSTPDVGLPPHEARERLSWAALQLAIAYLGVYGLYIATYTPAYLTSARPGLDIARDGAFPMEHACSVVTIGMSLVVFLLARGRRMPAHLAQDLGLIFYVGGAAGISMFEHWEPRPEAYTPISITWVCLWITLYPMMVPATRGKLFVAALAAACTGPMALILSVALRGGDLPAAQVLAWVLVPPFLAFALAVYPTPHIHRLESALEKVREMGSYKLTELLSRGGMGEVWKAKHRLLARPAAIKLIRPDVLAGTHSGGRTQALRRFEREARIISSLCSPNTVQVYDFGVTEDGSFYTVMELLDGLDLETLVRRHGPVPPERAVFFLVQACESLAEAHARQLIHRDVKPANLIACRYGMDVDFIKVLDFGLVRANRANEPGDTQLTADGLAAGTPAYISPELARGDTHYDHRVDLYGLGCVAHWLLTGKTVFKAANPMAMLLKHVQEDARAPSSMGAPVPAALDQLVLDCLAKNPADRPRDAGAMRSRLESIALDEDWTVQRARAWWAEHHVELAGERPR